MSCTAGTLYAHALYTYNDQPDAYGNITHTYSIGHSGERHDTWVEYATPIGGSIYDKPKHTYSTGTGSTGTVAEKWFLYDGLGYGQVGALRNRIERDQGFA
ncbi:MAG: hypothetical protein U0587_10405 [Candidatus Binatia bacterium]